MKTALQIYSVRDGFRSDPAATIEQLASFGLDAIEVWDLLGHDPRDVRRWLEAVGMEACAFNTGIDELEADASAVYRDAEALGTQTIVVCWVPPSVDSAVTREYVRRIAGVTAHAEAAGFRVGFHPHAEDYDVADDGSVLVDLMLAEVPSLFMEVDLGWAWIARRDLAALVGEQARGRTPILHCKDFARQDDRETYTSVGEGGVPFLETLRVAEGVEWVVAEQDENFEPDQMGAAERSCRRLLALRDELRGIAAGHRG